MAILRLEMKQYLTGENQLSHANSNGTILCEPDNFGLDSATKQVLN